MSVDNQSKNVPVIVTCFMSFRHMMSHNVSLSNFATHGEPHDLCSNFVFFLPKEIVSKSVSIGKFPYRITASEWVK